MGIRSTGLGQTAWGTRVVSAVFNGSFLPVSLCLSAPFVAPVFHMVMLLLFLVMVVGGGLIWGICSSWHFFFLASES